MKNELLNIIDFERVNSLLEGFNQTTGYVTAILDLEGNVLSKSGWREICTKFHRTHPETNKKCTISDTVLANKLADGEKYHHYKCLNGLVDVAVPLILKGEHVANLFTGQFFFEKPDTSLFLRQAEKYGFDKKEYLAALENVPVITEEKARVAIAFLLNMTNLISNLSVQKMQQKILAEQLKSSEERWQFALEGSGDGVWDWNTQTNKVFFSKRWKEMLGYEENEIADNVDEWEKRIHPDDKENCYLDLNKHFNGETDFYSNEHRVLCKDGSYKWILDRGKVISWIEEKKPLRIIGTHVDLTEHKLAEEKIRESQEYNRILFDLSVIGLAVTTMEGKLIDVNKTYAEIIGRTIEETKLLTYWEITPKKYAEQEQQQLDSLEKTGRYGPYEKEYIHKDGRYIPVRLKGKIIELGGEKYIWSSIEDITDQKLAKEALIHEKEFSEKIIDTSSAIIIGLDKNHLIRIFNKGAENITAYSKSEVIGRDWFTLFFTKDIIAEMNAVWSDAWGSLDHSHTNNILTKKGTEKIISWQTTGMYDDPDENKHLIISIGEDITERKQAEIILRDEKEQKRVILELVGNPIFLKDNEHRIIFANQAFFDLFGLDENSVTSKTLAENVPENEREHFLRVDRNVLDTGITDEREEELTVNGFTHTIITRKARFINESGSKFLVGTIHDITERKHSEVELAKYQNQLEELVKERTAQLEESTNVLKKINNLFIGREIRMKELKEEIKKLKNG